MSVKAVEDEAERSGSAHVVVLGNEKGGSDKSTTAIHVAVAHRCGSWMLLIGRCPLSPVVVRARHRARLLARGFAMRTFTFDRRSVFVPRLRGRPGRGGRELV